MKTRRTPITLVLIGGGFAAAGVLSGCSGDDAPVAMERKGYATLADCVADWGDPKDCQTQAPSSSRSGYVGGAMPYFWGPYYSQAGRVYHYDGRTSQRAVGAAPRGMATESTTQPPSSVRGSMPGNAPTSRGGFGSSGRSSSSFSSGG